MRSKPTTAASSVVGLTIIVRSTGAGAEERKVVRLGGAWNRILVPRHGEQVESRSGGGCGPFVASL